MDTSKKSNFLFALFFTGAITVLMFLVLSGTTPALQIGVSLVVGVVAGFLSYNPRKVIEAAPEAFRSAKAKIGTSLKHSLEYCLENHQMLVFWTMLMIPGLYLFSFLDPMSDIAGEPPLLVRLAIYGTIWPCLVVLAFMVMGAVYAILTGSSHLAQIIIFGCLGIEYTHNSEHSSRLIKFIRDSAMDVSPPPLSFSEHMHSYKDVVYAVCMPLWFVLLVVTAAVTFLGWFLFFAVPGILIFVARLIAEISDLAFNFALELNRIVHSQLRTMVMIDGPLGGFIGYAIAYLYTDGAMLEGSITMRLSVIALGGILAVGLGLVNHKIVARKILEIEPAT